MMKKIKVFLADSNVIFREGMHTVLECEEDIEVIGEGTSAEEALTFLKKEAVDVLVLGGGAGEGIRRVAEARPSIRLIFVGDPYLGKEQALTEKLTFLSRDTEPAELVAAVREVGSDNLIASAHDGEAEVENRSLNTHRGGNSNVMGKTNGSQ